MRNVTARDQNWIFEDNGQFIGLRTGGDFCAEHELGMKPIFKAFIPSRNSAEGLGRFKIERMHRELVWVSNKDYEGIAFLTAGKPESKLRYHTSMSVKNDPVVAWDQNHFLIVASKQGDPRHLQAVKALWEAFNRKDILFGGPFSERFDGGGIGLFIASAIPQNEIEAAKSKIREKARVDRMLADGAKREKLIEIKDKLQKQRKSWIRLEANNVNDDGSISYWLNPMDQENNYFGPVSIEDLKDWLEDKGKIPGNGRRQRSA